MSEDTPGAIASFTGLPMRDIDMPEQPDVSDDPETPAPVRYLPTWDATLLVHCRRALILPEKHRPRIFNTKAPQSFPTFLVDGAVAGAWRHVDGAIERTAFAKLDRATERELDAEAARLVALHA